MPFWNEVAATAEACIGNECPRFDDCFVTRMRLRAEEAQIVIVNHHLYFADLALRPAHPYVSEFLMAQRPVPQLGILSA